MAFFTTIRLMTMNVSLTEPIMRNILKQSSKVTLLTDIYVENLKNLNITLTNANAYQLLQFPYRYFHLFSDNDMKSIINESFKVIKDKDLANSTEVYNAFMHSLVQYDRNADVDSIVNEMRKKQITFNALTYEILIQYYGQRGDFAGVEEIVNKMKSLKLQLRNKHLVMILSAYYMSGQQEKAQSFINENKMDENGIYVLLPKAKGYAKIGDVNNATKVVMEIFRNNLSFSSKYCFTIYYLLVGAGAPKSQLEKIIKLMKKMAVEQPIHIHYTIQKLNKINCFNQSLDFLKDFLHLVDEPTAFYTVELFTIQACPKDVYKDALKLLLGLVGTTNNTFHAFSNLEFEEAIEFAKKEYNESNIENICKSLINKAIREKSMHNIEISIDFAMRNMIWSRVNMILQHLVLPLSMELKILSNHEEILTLFPKFKNIFLSVILMNYLNYGKFKEFNALREQYPHVNNVHFMSETGYLSKIINENLSHKEIEQMELEGKKYFTEKCIRELIYRVSFHKIVLFLRSNLDITEIFLLLKKLDYPFREDDFSYLKSKCPNKIEVFKPFFLSLLKVDKS